MHGKATVCATSITLACLGTIGILLLLYPWYPEAHYRVQRIAGSHPSVAQVLPGPLKPIDSHPPPETGNWITIPAINVRERILEGDDLSVLDHHRGAWHQTGALDGNYVIAGHRFQYLPPNTETFYHLGKLKAGDEIILTLDGVHHSYRIAEVKRVFANQTSILDTTSSPRYNILSPTYALHMW